MADKVSGSRIGRLARLGWLSRHALPIAWERLRGGRSSSRDSDATDEWLADQAVAATETLRSLGELKGLALKLGQMLSYLDGALPEPYRAVYQKALAPLQREAPALPFAAVEQALVGRPREADRGALRRFEERPFAAASIGQVHRAHAPRRRRRSPSRCNTPASTARSRAT